MLKAFSSTCFVGLLLGCATVAVAQENPFPQVQSGIGTEDIAPPSNQNSDSYDRGAAAPDPSRAAPSQAAGAQYTQRYDAPLGLQSASWTYIPPPPTRTLQMNDIVTIRVDEIARVQAEGSASTRKNGLYDTLLKDWINLRGGKLQPDTHEGGDLRLQGTVNSLYRADSEIESREALSFNIAARVVDIRPNGNLVVEAHKTMYVNENVWETFLSGTCRSEDIGPDNVVLSRDLLDLQIRKNDRGRMRDGYKRGWFTRWFETLQPF
ncbi:flagellar basal body L-ring protein FlgH [Rosistilla oblonga]|uniref:flagellar basal body L-ring protein FlgH n=1 Tax=Rosistilla oblonga TaxID=2527990 RepID=UPI003A96AA32